MTPPDACFALPERLSVADDNPLVPFLTATRGRDITLDARALKRLDTLLLQTLVAAAADRRTMGARLVLSGLSPALARNAARLGITPDHLLIEASL